MKRTGEILKKAREQKGLSIHEIGLSLKISSKILKAIEDGDMTQLPAKTFLRGFVQSYANYLRLDVNDVLRIFQEEMGTTRPGPIAPAPTNPRGNNDEAEFVPAPANAPRSGGNQEQPLNSLVQEKKSKTALYTVLGLVLVGLIIFTKKMIDKYQKESVISEVEVTTPLPGSDTPAVTPAPADSESAPVSSSMGGSTQEPVSTPLLTPTPSAAARAALAASPSPTLAHSPTPSLSPAPTTTPKPTATPTPSPTPTPAATPTPAPSASPSPSPTVSPTPNNKPVEVIIEALDAVEIEYVTRDGKSEKIKLAAEQVHTFKSKSGLKLNISNGGAVNVIVNGRDLGIPGNLGKPVKLSY